MLVSLDGAEYYNLVDGATNTLHFLQFFEEAGKSVNMQTCCLQVGDIIVMDNWSSNHYEGGEILKECLAEMGSFSIHQFILLISTPSNFVLTK